MSEQVSIDDIHILGDLDAGGIATPADASIEDKHVAAAAAIQRYKLAQDATVVFSIPLLSFRVWNNLGALLPDPAATDDLALNNSVFGTNSPYLSTGDLKAAGSTTRYSRAIYQIPPEYDDFQSADLVIHAGMITTVSDTTAQAAVNCHRSNKDGTVSAALTSSSLTTINSLTFASKTWALTVTDLRGGDILDIRVYMAINDGATGTAVIGAIGSVELQCDVRG